MPGMYMVCQRLGMCVCVCVAEVDTGPGSCVCAGDVTPMWLFIFGIFFAKSLIVVAASSRCKSAGLAVLHKAGPITCFVLFFLFPPN